MLFDHYVHLVMVALVLLCLGNCFSRDLEVFWKLEHKLCFVFIDSATQKRALPSYKLLAEIPSEGLSIPLTELRGEKWCHLFLAILCAYLVLVRSKITFREIHCVLCKVTSSENPITYCPTVVQYYCLKIVRCIGLLQKEKKKSNNLFLFPVSKLRKRLHRSKQ